MIKLLLFVALVAIMVKAARAALAVVWFGARMGAKIAFYGAVIMVAALMAVVLF